MIKKIIYIITLIIFVFPSFAQNKVDSLMLVLKQNDITDTSYINTLNKISEETYRTNPDTSSFFAKEALLKSKKINYELGLLSAYKNIATVYYFKSKYDLAIENFKLALEIAKKRNDQTQLSEIYNDIGVTYKKLGFYDDALTYYFKSLKIAEEKNNNFNISNSLNNIAIVYKKQGLIDKALEYYEKSLEIATEINDEYGILITNNNLGVLYRNLKQYDKSAKYYLKALSIAQRLNNKKDIANCYTNIGTVYRQKNNYKKAMSYYEFAVEIKNNLGDKQGIAVLYSNIASVYLDIAKETDTKNKKDILYKAIDFGERAYLIAKEIKALPQAKESSKILKDAYKELGNYKKSLSFSEEFIKINDSINNIQKNKALTEIEVKYETKKQEIENAALKKENEQQKKKQELLVNIAILTMSVFIALIFIILTFTRKQKKANKVITKKNKSLKNIEEELKFKNKKLLSLYEDTNTKNEIIQRQINALSESEAHFRLAQEAGEIGTWEWDAISDEVVWSKITYKIFGIEKRFKKITNDMFFSFVHPEDKQRLRDEFEKAVKNKKTKYRVEYRIVKNNQVSWVVDTSKIVFDNNGKLLRKIGVIQDITERKRILNAINENNEKQRILINNIPVHIYFKDTNLRYVLVNASYANLFGLTVKDIIGKTDDEIANSSIANFYQNLDKQVIETKKPIVDLQREHKSPNGEKYWAKTSKMPYFGDQNQIKGVIGIVNDITQQVQNEKKMKLQTEILENAHKDITDSISYAKTIQQALLPNKNIVDNYFNEYFVFYKPKETVSGDFYYLSEKEDYIIFAVADCTGHGVPGGFLTMLGITYLNDIIKRRETDNVGEALDILRQRIKSTFNMYKSDNTNGLDIALCAINRDTNVLQYAGAFNPLWIIRNNELIEYKATRNPIGMYFNEVNFKTNTIQLYDNDLIYLFSDGYLDQIGGKDNKKFLIKRFRKLLLDNHKLPMKEQEEVYYKTLNNWQKQNEQIDDITIMGIKWKIS